MNILVTGSTGFIGNHLVASLVSLGHKVVCLVRPNSNTSLLPSTNVEIISGSISDDVQLQKSLKGIDVVHHLAVDYSNFESSLLDTTRILNFCSDLGVGHFIYYSTVNVHGIIRNKAVIDEHTPFINQDPYTLHKIQCEKNVIKISDKNDGLNYTIIRPSLIYGEGDVHRYFLYKAIQDNKFRFIGDGSNKLGLCYIKNLIDAILLINGNDGAFNKKYLISDQKSYEMVEFVNQVCECLGIEPISKFWSYNLAEKMLFPYKVYRAITKHEIFIVPENLDFFKIDFECNINKIQEELGYIPEVSMKEGVSKSIEWYRKEGLLS